MARDRTTYRLLTSYIEKGSIPRSYNYKDCLFCGASVAVPVIKNYMVCEECIDALNKIPAKQWKKAANIAFQKGDKRKGKLFRILFRHRRAGREIYVDKLDDETAKRSYLQGKGRRIRRTRKYG